ncbi:hypothetical protein AB9J70_15205 [Elizabethkingia anophelis]|uniref:hypothetical protein n=1 Tax=Elizabethkingia anophelis TaxID=1117645 RepID=UPI003556C606
MNNFILCIHNAQRVYVEGFSQTQYSMMKFSGMTGMLGNQIFMNNSLYIDCLNHKLGVD